MRQQNCHLVGRYQPSAPLLLLDAFDAVLIGFRDVFPPSAGRAPFFRPRGTAPVVRLAVCSFWPAIVLQAYGDAGLRKR